MKNTLPRSFLLLIVVLLLTSTAFCKDDWIQVRSKNFFVIGNASERDIRKVAARLEQFREAFRLAFKHVNLVSPIATNVIVFKSDSSYKAFKPKRSDGKIDTFVAGYFQPGDDVNYITLSVQGDDTETFRTIFHEYVHFIIDTNFGRYEVPAWFNEGLAEYYSTFQIEQDQVVKLGLLVNDHLMMLNQSQMMPLSTLFSIRTEQLNNSGEHSRTIFYAQSWALVHYLIQSGKSGSLNKFLDAVLNGTQAEPAFKAAFQQDYDSMEASLKSYVGQRKYQATQLTFSQKFATEADMQVSPLPGAMSNAYLGDLLYHIHRADDAEPFLLSALQADPGATLAKTSLGMVKLQQRKFDDARRYLESAIDSDKANAYALYRYAYLLSREGTDEYGISKELSPTTIEKMRDALHRSIAANPAFTESYDLLAFVDLAAQENLDEAANAMLTAIKYQPGTERFSLRLAEIYMRQEKYDQARALAERVAKATQDADSLQWTSNMLRYLDERQKYEQRRAEYEKQRKDGEKTPTLGPKTDPAMSRQEVAEANALANLQSMNAALREPEKDETRTVGSITRIDCSRRPIGFTVRAGNETFTLTSKDFQGLKLTVFDPAMTGAAIGCDAKVDTYMAVVTYKIGPPSPGNKGPRGEIVSIEFVPSNFRLLTAQEMSQARPRLVRREDVDSEGFAVKPDQKAVTTITAEPAEDELRAAQRDAIRKQMLQALRQPAEGERREMGYLDKIDCGKAVHFVLRTASTSLRLLDESPQTLPIRIYTPDLSGMQFGCSIKPIEYPAVFVYRPAADPKSKVQGTIVSIEFVPKDFKLD